MEAIQVIEEILSKVFKWHRFPVSLKTEAVLLYFKGLSLRAVREFLLHKGYEVSIETIREWFHAVGRALQAVYTTFTSSVKKLPIEWIETFRKRTEVLQEVSLEC